MSVSLEPLDGYPPDLPYSEHLGHWYFNGGMLSHTIPGTTAQIGAPVHANPLPTSVLMGYIHRVAPDGAIEVSMKNGGVIHNVARLLP